MTHDLGCRSLERKITFSLPPPFKKVDRQFLRMHPITHTHFEKQWHVPTSLHVSGVFPLWIVITVRLYIVKVHVYRYVHLDNYNYWTIDRLFLSSYVTVWCRGTFDNYKYLITAYSPQRVHIAGRKYMIGIVVLLHAVMAWIENELIVSRTQSGLF